MSIVGRSQQLPTTTNGQKFQMNICYDISTNRTYQQNEIIPKDGDPCKTCTCVLGIELCQNLICPEKPAEDCREERRPGECCPNYLCGNNVTQLKTFPLSSNQLQQPEVATNTRHLTTNNNMMLLNTKPQQQPTNIIPIAASIQNRGRSVQAYNNNNNIASPLPQQNNNIRRIQLPQHPIRTNELSNILPPHLRFRPNVQNTNGASNFLTSNILPNNGMTFTNYLSNMDASKILFSGQANQRFITHQNQPPTNPFNNNALQQQQTNNLNLNRVNNDFMNHNNNQIMHNTNNNNNLVVTDSNNNQVARRTSNILNHQKNSISFNNLNNNNNRNQLLNVDTRRISIDNNDNNSDGWKQSTASDHNRLHFQHQKQQQSLINKVPSISSIRNFNTPAMIPSDVLISRMSGLGAIDNNNNIQSFINSSRNQDSISHHQPSTESNNSVQVVNWQPSLHNPGGLINVNTQQTNQIHDNNSLQNKKPTVVDNEQTTTTTQISSTTPSQISSTTIDKQSTKEQLISSNEVKNKIEDMKERVLFESRPAFGLNVNSVDTGFKPISSPIINNQHKPSIISTTTLIPTSTDADSSITSSHYQQPLPTTTSTIGDKINEAIFVSQPTLSKEISTTTTTNSNIPSDDYYKNEPNLVNNSTKNYSPDNMITTTTPIDLDSIKSSTTITSLDNKENSNDQLEKKDTDSVDTSSVDRQQSSVLNESLFTIQPEVKIASTPTTDTSTQSSTAPDISTSVSPAQSTSQSSTEISNDNPFDDPSAMFRVSECNIYGRIYQVGQTIEELSDVCKRCTCTSMGVDCQNRC